ncbi:MAG: sigma 54-interacting transcriptional regulator [Calditrichaceae bacterium]|nr:sigma 54-interacting transcriptional regulator [Calditrichaceae bacterium]MBN2710278.1 sigma 54-interacting transcriptional regulator [Calditrichaceae bacterium]RQV93897.1 MAG: CHASE2 domain-containing protein [Calditrichota bacterium]
MMNNKLIKKLRPFSNILIISFLFCLLSVLPFETNNAFVNIQAEVLYGLRGQREVSDRIVLIHINDEDIKALGGWPITRDYYSYLIHLLNERRAKTIALDVFFAGSDPYYPQQDTILANFIGSSANVCLPMFFLSITGDSSTQDALFLPEGNDPSYPLNLFGNKAACLGFSNFGKEAVVQHTPLLLRSGKDIYYSYGLAAALRFMDGEARWNPDDSHLHISSPLGEIRVELNDDAELWLNHFGPPDKIEKYSFVDILKELNEKPEQYDFENKLIWIMVSVTGTTTIKSTPLNDLVPSSLIHYTTAENIINNCWLTEAGWIPCFISIFILAALGLYLPGFTKSRLKYLYILIIPVVFLGIVLFIFSFYNLIVPVFYPVLAFFVSAFIVDRRLNREAVIKHRQMIGQEINLKSEELEQAKKRLSELEFTLRNEKQITETSLEIAKERKDTIFRLEKELDDLRSFMINEKPFQKDEFAEIIHSKESRMTGVLELVLKVSADNIPVLIYGETGTGKELIARSIHRNSKRNKQPFIAVNCGALSETLLESELFGHEKGSFTGAVNRRKGRFELADGGTIFLDEISETSAAFQSRLLRVLQEGTFERLGGEQGIRVDVRVIAATNKDLQQAVNEGKFRLDLYFRLNGVTINLPSLRERQSDIPLLVRHILSKYNYEHVKEVSTKAVEALVNYTWPGNVRELENVIRRAAIFAQSDGRQIIQVKDFPDEIVSTGQAVQLSQIHKPIEEQILEILRSLKFSHSAISQAAKILGNRDRGTVTEYLRGMCFEQLVENAFDYDKAAERIAGCPDSQLTGPVKLKISQYMENIIQIINDKSKIKTSYKGLPKKYHVFLDQIIEHLQAQNH